MNAITRLEQLRSICSDETQPGWDRVVAWEKLCHALDQLAPELIALWKEAIKMRALMISIYGTTVTTDTLDALNAKAEEVLK